MIDRSFDVANLPMLMTTSEVCAVGRFSKRTLHRRMRDELIALTAIGRGREKLYLRSDVVRALRLTDEGAATPPPADRPRVDIDAIRAAKAGSRRASHSAEPPQLKLEPLTPERHRALLLSVRPGIRVRVEDDGRYSVSFVARRNVRAASWPPVIPLPRGRPGSVTLADQSEYEALIAEAEAIRSECRAALLVEKAQEGPKSAR